ncbi:MAG: bacillithiol biosynthesis deacetylase BshB1 [Balneolaceae bacterium]|nr:bacillithiol biosynthesis deacetylase BshB1 [Balneolaceae bacterium]
MKLDVLALAAHPDDTELSCSGTLAALVQQGLRVGVIDLTRGEMGTRGTPALRLKEAAEAAQIIGLHARDNLGLPDTELHNTRELQLPIIERIRFYKPHICLINAPKDRHPDHGHAAALQLDSIFYSGLKKIETKGPDGKLQEPHRPVHVLHYIQDQPLEPDFIFDISDSIDIKEKAIKAFSSQFNVAEPGDELETYISDPDFFVSLRARAKQLGHLGGFTYGEGFIYYKKPFPISNFSFLMESSPKR